MLDICMEHSRIIINKSTCHLKSTYHFMITTTSLSNNGAITVWAKLAQGHILLDGARLAGDGADCRVGRSDRRKLTDERVSFARTAIRCSCGSRDSLDQQQARVAAGSIRRRSATAEIHPDFRIPEPCSTYQQTERCPKTSELVHCINGNVIL